MSRLSVTLLLCVLCQLLLAATPARAQNVSGCGRDSLDSLTAVTIDGNRTVFSGTEAIPVKVDCDNSEFYANTIEIFRNEGRIVATGDVLFVSGPNRISAERVDFNTKTKTGTFYKASGTTVIRDKSQPSPFGSQEPNAYFWGDELHKTGPDTYRIVDGGFTACVQPTPRWEVTSGSITLNLDDYALLRNSVFKVKGVPLLYLPIFYYPMEEEDRATGFLMPIYGNDTIKGHSISAPFFWAINRSQDATVTYDWYSQTGQGVTGEYRYVLSPGSSGNATFNLLNERAIAAGDTGSGQAPRPGRQSYNIVGALGQALPHGFVARANANYFTSLETQQRYQQDVFQATTRSRNFDGSLTGTWNELQISARADRRDYFDTTDTLRRTGNLPRIGISRGERPIGKLPIYFGTSGEYVNIVQTTMKDNVELSNQGLSRFDVRPTLRVPFTKWQFLTVNSAVSWRGTYWTESLDPKTGQQIDSGLGRQYYDFTARITGPVFNRIFNTPGGGFAEKYKHVIEPTFTIQRTSSIDVENRIVRLDSGDYVVGGVTQFVYGVSNRLYAKKDVSREIASVTVNQTYYSKEQAANVDPNYQSSYNQQTNGSNFSSIRLAARANPTDRFGTEFKTEWSPIARTLTTFAASGSLRSGEWLDLSGTWSRRRYIPGLANFDNPTFATHTIGAASRVRSHSNRFGGTYSIDYDFQHSYLVQQTVQWYYNAQCCGVVMEWQGLNTQGIPGVTVPNIRRFNISFSLAGIGTFSNFLGALGGQQRQR